MPISVLRSRRHFSDCTNHLLPFRFLDRQLPLTQWRQPVIFEFTFSVAAFPFRIQPTLPFQSVQRGIERAMFDLKHVIRAALDVLCDLMTVSWSRLKRPQDQHVECASK